MTNRGDGLVEGCENGGVRDVVSGLFARSLVWGDVDPHGGGLYVGWIATNILFNCICPPQ